MTSLKSLIVELNIVLDSAPAPRRAAILQAITDLLLEGSDTFSDELVAAFDMVLLEFLTKTEREPLISLGHRLATIDNPPVEVVQRLARNDDIAIAGPVLTRSNALHRDGLAAIAKSKGGDHLLALAARRQLDEAVTDILIERGTAPVIRRVASNEGAAISHVGFVRLLDKAKHDQELAAMVADRRDMPPELQPFLQLSLADA